MNSLFSTYIFKTQSLRSQLGIWVSRSYSKSIYGDLETCSWFILEIFQGFIIEVPFLDTDTSLNSYIRNHVNLRGTKAMCHEGGCGACIVAVTAQHPVTKRQETFAVNSCLVSILSCHKWDITTIEGIGNKIKGYHPIQERLAALNGTQCGYCSPGFVMNMYSLYEVKPHVTMKEVENSFASNICRCTGYRPIADAFKSFAKDAPPSIKYKIRDIEDLHICKKTGAACNQTSCDFSNDEDLCEIDGHEVPKLSNHYETIQEPLHLQIDNIKWFKVYSLKNLLEIFNKEGIDSYRLIAGNTAQGVYNFKERVTNTPRVMIDISSVADLRKYEFDTDLALGGNMTLTEIMYLFLEMAQKNEYYEYLVEMYNHMDLIAHIPIRNIGTVGGNLSIKHQNREFPSDMFLIFETVGATMQIVDRNEKYKTITFTEYLDTDMNGKVIYRIFLPPLSENHKYKSYKIMRRAQNAHAIVDAGFLFKIINNTVKSARIVYGGINPEFIHASKTEKVVTGKNIFTDSVLQAALKCLNAEIVPNEAPPEPRPEYRKKLAIGLFYKNILNICPKERVNSRYLSGGEIFDRPVSSGKQEFTTRKEVWPINEPIPKIEALAQTTGEATYSNDIPTLPKELYAAFILATEFGGEIDKIDATEALKMEGVVKLFVASDIPGRNTFTPLPSIYLVEEEELFCSGKIRYNEQPVGLIVAETEKLANTAALKVKVTYKNSIKKKPLIYLRDVIADKTAPQRITKAVSIEPKTKGNDTTKVIKGSFDIYSQYHYTMETQTTVCVPTENGLDVHTATQWVDWAQFAIAAVLNIPESSVNVTVRRVGGSYGCKISRGLQISTACALAAYKLNRPVRFVLSIEQNMKALGKREACSTDYEVGVNDDGKIQYLNSTFYEDSGFSNNESFVLINETIKTLNNGYNISTWSVNGNAVLTDKTSQTWCRAPGTTEAIAMVETMLEHIAVETGKDPVQVRLANMDLTDNPLPDMIDYFKTKAEYTEREEKIQKFNSENRWKKRGISLIPMKYSIDYFGNFAVHVSVYHSDGSVAVSHGGIEMGQGVNTKVAQVVSYTLNIPLEKINVRPSNSFVTPNARVSGASQVSELCCLGAKRACERILEKLAPIKDKMINPTWVELVEMAFIKGVNLAENFVASEDERKSYKIWGVTITEVEIDVLTGNHEILRVDILEDVGESLNPEVDVGQIEGAFVMGLGYWTCESIMHDKNTGALLTNRTWNYKTPGIKDIPIDFRIEFKKDSPNPLGVLRSKATGEPALTMSYSIVLALRRAITAARADGGLPADKWFNIEMPASPESILMATQTNLNDYKLT